MDRHEFQSGISASHPLYDYYKTIVGMIYLMPEDQNIQFYTEDEEEANQMVEFIRRLDCTSYYEDNEDVATSQYTFVVVVKPKGCKLTTHTIPEEIDYYVCAPAA